MCNGAQAFQESLIARGLVDGADEAAIDFQVVQADIVQLADFTELAAKVFDAEAAAVGALPALEGEAICIEQDDELRLDLTLDLTEGDEK